MPLRDNSEASSSDEYELYILRHGIAAPAEGSGVSADAKRQLSPEGRKKMQEIARGVLRIASKIDWIVASPLVRAVETAGIVADALGSNPPLDVCDALRPGGSFEELITLLATRQDRRRVLVVGHEPDLSQLAAELVGAGQHAGLAFKKGGCCMIGFDKFPSKSSGTLIWWLTPRILRKLA